MENSIHVQIKQFPQPPAESSDNSDSHSSRNGHKATLVKLLSKNNISIDKFCMVYLSSENAIIFYRPNDMNYLSNSAGVWLKLTF